MNSRDRRAVILGGGSLILLAVTWLIILPWWDDWSEARQQIIASRQGLEELQQQTERVLAMERQLEPVLGAAVKKPLAGAAVSRIQLLKDVMDLHAKAGVQIRGIQPEANRPLRELPGVVRLPVQVQSTCQPLQLVQLLSAGKNSTGLLLVDRVDAAPGPQGPGSLNVTIVWSTLARQENLP